MIAFDDISTIKEKVISGRLINTRYDYPVRGKWSDPLKL